MFLTNEVTKEAKKKIMNILDFIHIIDIDDLTLDNVDHFLYWIFMYGDSERVLLISPDCKKKIGFIESYKNNKFGKFRIIFTDMIDYENKIIFIDDKRFH